MPRDGTLKSASLEVGKYTGDVCAQVLKNHNYTDADERVYKDSPVFNPNTGDFPYIYYNVREMPSALLSNRDTEDTRAVSNIRVVSLDDLEASKLGRDLQEMLVDRSNRPSITGFDVIWHDLVLHEPMNELREDADPVFGRILEVEYELEPNA